MIKIRLFKNTKHSKDRFKGILTDKELNIIEEALEYYKSKDELPIKDIDALILQLYRFWEIDTPKVSARV
jgi:hypothetical protein